MDFITHLPKSRSGWDALTVFVDRLTKMVRLHPGRSTDTAKDIALHLRNAVYRNHGIPKSIVTDRDPRFTSKFWKAFHELLKTKLLMSSAFHPQTDGQTEQMNCTIEQVLHCYIDYNQKNWDELTPLVEFAINSHRQASTEHSPFFLNYGFHPRTPDEASLPDSPFPNARHSIVEIQSTLTAVKDILAEAQERQRTYANQRRSDLTFTPGDKVIIRMINPLDLQRQRPSSKLLPVYEGPFTILERIGQVAYRLHLPDHIHIHPVFHISRLKEYVPPESFSNDRDVPPRPPPILLDTGEEEYEIEVILDKRIHRRQPQYLVKWFGYGDEHNQWLPLKELGHSMDLVQDFEASRLS
jgi:hypothetical protein